jgi:hypothetical protein
VRERSPVSKDAFPEATSSPCGRQKRGDERRRIG